MKRKSTRIIFEINQEYYKFASFFVDRNDNSFYFHLYEEADENFKSYNVISENGTTKIEFDNINEHDFKRNKLSIHQSGYIHSTDKNGKRLKDNIVGIPFSQIESSKLILILLPKKIDTLLKLEKIDHSRDVCISITLGNPFSINFEIFKISEIENLSTIHENNILQGYVEIIIDEKDYGLRIYLQSINGPRIWPKFSVALTRIG
jgi:hypothetical protein